VDEGNRKYHAKKYDEARKSYSDAERYAPGDREKKKLRFNHGDARYMQGDFEGAADEFREALKSEDKDVQKKALFNMGNAFLKKGEIEKAISAYMGALAVDPNYLPAKKNIEYLLRKKDPPKDKNSEKGKKDGNNQSKKHQQEGTEQQKKGDKKGGNADAQSSMSAEQLQNLLEMMKQSPVRRQKSKGGVRVHEKTW
jgi:Ca-activated chloride channel family protein